MYIPIIQKLRDKDEVPVFGQRAFPHKCTYGGKPVFDSIKGIIKEKQGRIVGEFSCKGYDTFGPFKLIGGISKGHPDKNDLDNAKAFFKGLCKNRNL